MKKYILILTALGIAMFLFRNKQQIKSNVNTGKIRFMTNVKSLWNPPSTAAPYITAIKAAENKYNLPDNLLARLLHQESRYRADIITGKTKSRVGATGIAQFMPATAKQFNINPSNPFQSIDAAGLYLSKLYNRFGQWDKALAAYNWGQGNVSRKGLVNAPLETRNYYTQIMRDIGLG